MSSFILPSNIKKYDAINAFNDLNKVHWTQHNNKSLKIGDTVYIYESKPTQRIILKTKVIDRDVYKYHIDDFKYSKSDTDFSTMRPWFTLQLIENITTNISFNDLKKMGLKGNIQSLRKLDSYIAQAIELLISDSTELSSISLIEGKKIGFYTTRYERNIKNRKAAIDLHGLTCKACGFNFEQTYGSLGQGFIEVHHKRPLFLENHEVIINPSTDLVPLCSNCHRMIHKDKTNTLTVENLKMLLH